MDLGLKGRTAVVTGGGTGIGKAAALEFAREGATTYITGRRVERLEEAVEEAKKEGLTLIPHALDVGDKDSIQKAVDDIAADTGRIDIWVNNAGFGKYRMLEDQDEDHWNTTIDTNLKSIVLCTQIVAREMKKRQYGVFLNASSLAVYLPLAGNAVYAAVKSGVVALTKAYAGELGPYGIRVVSYAPGMVVTEMNIRHVSEDYQKLVNTMAVGRLGEPPELAKPIVFLASEAAGYITGVDIMLTGGRYCTQNNEDMWAAAGDAAIKPKKITLLGEVKQK